MLFQKVKFSLVAACLAFGSLALAQEQIAVGVSMPEFSNMRWVNDGLSIMRELNKVNLRQICNTPALAQTCRLRKSRA